MANAVSLKGQQQGAMNTLSLLLLFLLSIVSFAFGSLYFEARHKIKLLSTEVKQLQSSQVLLMLPDEQAEAVAQWMENNPNFVQPAIERAKQGTSQVLSVGPGVKQPSKMAHKTVNNVQANESPKLEPMVVKPATLESKIVANKTTLSAKEKPVNQVPVRPQNAVTLEEMDDGVKLISLPHGGVRVTTRDPY